MNEGKYYCTHLHMHSCCEGEASMGGHLYEARRMGMQTLWFTDHDSRMGKKEHPVKKFDFESGALLVEEENMDMPQKVMEKQAELKAFTIDMDDFRWEDTRQKLEKSFGRYSGWTPAMVENPATADFTVTEEQAYEGARSLRITAEGDSDGDFWRATALTFVSNGNRHQHSLLSQVTVKIALFSEESFGEDCRVIFDIRMSQQPPEHQVAHLKYVIGNTEGIEQPYVTVIPIEIKTARWNPLEMKLSEDAERYAVGGLDNVFDTITISLEVRGQKRVICYLDDFQIISEFSFEPVRTRQRKLAEELGIKYGIVPMVGTEISSAGQHKNSFCSWVPIIDYEKWNYRVSHLEAVHWVKKNGGIFSLNHPFDSWKRLPLLPEEKKRIVEETAKRYIAARCDGASLLEVGFPMGRDQFNPEDYLTLWDALSANGIFITGYGDSDNHTNSGGWWSGNNFAAWIHAAAPVEELLLTSMKNGNVFTGDPAIFKGNMVFETLEGYGMGKVIKSHRRTWLLSFQADSLKTGWKICWVVDGNRGNPIVVEGDRYTGQRELHPINDLHFVRVEMYDETSRCILLTNPIYFVSTEEIEIPEDRLILYGETL